MSRPSLNFANETRGKFCSKHKLPDMINVLSKRCEHEDGCMSQPAFNFASERRGKFCFKHKLPDMINVKSKRCEHEGCMLLPSFNFANKRGRKFCSKHKLPDMIYVSINRCEHDGCMSLIPSFNFAAERKGIYCFQHKLAGMINVTNKNCQSPKCRTLALFGLLNKRAQFCLLHKATGMINVVMEQKCCVLDCDDEYDFVFEGTKYCSKHMPNNDDIGMNTKRLCKYCDIRDVSTFVCKSCRNVKNKKEWGVVRYLRRVIDTPFEFNSSRMLQGCSKKRPDIYFDLPTHCVIVEVDENQHIAYEDGCECARINEIVNGIGGRPLTIIRYNPDSVRSATGLVKKTNAERLDLLVETIKRELVSVPEAFAVNMVQLFYDDVYSVYMEIKREDITNIVCI